VTLLLTTPGWRGSGTSFRKIAAGLAGAGHDVAQVAGDAAVARRLAQPGMAVHHVPTGDTGRREVAAVRRLLADQGTEVVVCDAPRDVRIARYASLVRRRAIVWRYNLHGRHLATDLMQRWLFGGLAHVTHLSRHGAARLAATTPWLAHLPSSVIPNGFDIEALPPDRARGRAWRARHGFDDDTPLVLTPTPALTEKSVDVAAAAMAIVARHRAARWLVTDTAGRIAAAGVAPSDPVVALGPLEPDALHDAMRGADVVLLPGARELFGNVTGEAMALGRPVIGVADGATPEVIGDAGVLFPVGDAAAAAEALIALLDDAGRRERLGQAARQRIGERFSLAAMEAGFDRLVRDLA
jgi:glycosyltransferase involved in cell wall biosynthesis